MFLCQMEYFYAFLLDVPGKDAQDLAIIVPLCIKEKHETLMLNNKAKQKKGKEEKRKESMLLVCN